MKFRNLIGVLLAAAPLASAAAMPVSTFLAKADRLQKKGPMAMFSGDLARLPRQQRQRLPDLALEVEHTVNQIVPEGA